MDDIEADGSTTNPENYYKLQDKITKSIIPSGSSETNVICVGTIHHHNSLLGQMTDPKEFPGWEKRIYKSIISWSSNPQLWQQWVKIYHYQEEYNSEEGPIAADKFFASNKDAMLQGTKVLWPECKGYYQLMVDREQLGSISFDAEMQNEPVNPRDCRFNIADTISWDDEYRAEADLLASLGKNIYIFGGCDPSLGKQNQNADYSAIISVALDISKDIIYVLDAIVVRKKPDVIIETILNLHKIRNYRSFAFETNQFQEYMATALQKKAMEMRLRLKIEEVSHSTNKFARIESLQPWVVQGKIRFCRKHHELLDQMKFFPKGKFDDALDALEMVVAIAKKPQKIRAVISGSRRRYDDSGWVGDYRRNLGWNLDLGI